MEEKEGADGLGGAGVVFTGTENGGVVCINGCDRQGSIGISSWGGENEKSKMLKKKNIFFIVVRSVPSSLLLFRWRGRRRCHALSRYCVFPSS